MICKLETKFSINQSLFWINDLNSLNNFKLNDQKICFVRICRLSTAILRNHC